MDEIKLSNDVIEQIKDFDNEYLSKEQESLVDKLMLNRESKFYYRKYGLCKECKQLNTDSYRGYLWCQSCNSKLFQQNFKHWTSGNHDVDELIRSTQLNAKTHREVIEWIDRDRFENIKYLAKGGFGATYRAIWKDGYIKWWDFESNPRNRDRYDMDVALKLLHDSQNVTVEFLKGIASHATVNGSESVIRCYGITKDPETNNFLMVMDFAQNGSLRRFLDHTFNSLTWSRKLNVLYTIARGLTSIHSKKIIHHDLHCGNILYGREDFTIITDLGLCRPANENSENRIYGVLPYVAPEVLRGKGYTQASDIYGFGIVAYEICTGYPPYYDIDHNEELAIRICKGQRPNSNYKVPQILLDIINKCCDVDPSKRPTARELLGLFDNLEHNNEFNKQIREANEINKKSLFSSFSGSISYNTHPQAIYTSRLLEFKNLPEQLE